MDDDIRVVELFAGVGGLRIGLEKASKRFKTLWADQWEPGRKNQFAFDCYDAHFKDSGSKNVNEDIGKVWQDVPEHDLLVGGFPCQDYSVASTNAHGIEGKKGVLWWSINDIIRVRRPRYVLLENVDRLVRSPVNQRGRDFGIILRCLSDEGYDVEWRIVNAADYGLQQKRRRTFIFAVRNDQSFAETYSRYETETVLSKNGFFARTFPIKDKADSNKISTFSIGPEVFPTLVDVSDGFENTFYRAGIMTGYRVYTRDIEPCPPNASITLVDIIVDDADEKYYVKDISKWQYMKGAKRITRIRKDGSTQLFAEGAIPFPDRLDTPGRTMLTSEGSTNRSSHLILDPTTNRYRTLTPVECERLNGFPDNWTNTGMTDRQRYFTMGNALVVPLIAMMGRTLISIDDVRRFRREGYSPFGISEVAFYYIMYVVAVEPEALLVDFTATEIVHVFAISRMRTDMGYPVVRFSHESFEASFGDFCPCILPHLADCRKIIVWYGPEKRAFEQELLPFDFQIL